MSTSGGWVVRVSFLNRPKSWLEAALLWPPAEFSSSSGVDVNYPKTVYAVFGDTSHRFFLVASIEGRYNRWNSSLFRITEQWLASCGPVCCRVYFVAVLRMEGLLREFVRSSLGNASNPNAVCYDVHTTPTPAVSLWMGHSGHPIPLLHGADWETRELMWAS